MPGPDVVRAEIMSGVGGASMTKKDRSSAELDQAMADALAAVERVEHKLKTPPAKPAAPSDDDVEPEPVVVEVAPVKSAAPRASAATLDVEPEPLPLGGGDGHQAAWYPASSIASRIAASSSASPDTSTRFVSRSSELARGRKCR